MHKAATELRSQPNTENAVMFDAWASSAWGGVAASLPDDEEPIERVGFDPEGEFIPLEPKTLEEAGLSESEIESLTLKFLLNCGTATGRRIADQINLPAALVSNSLARMKAELLVVYKASSTLGDFVYQLTETGCERARRYSDRCTYFGSAPVPLDEYVVSVSRQSLTRSRPRIGQLRHAFGDLMLSPEMMSQLGQAINYGRGLFLYGAPGNGKTSFAERVTKAFGQHLWIPRTLTITGEMVRLFDPSNHTELPLDQLPGMTESTKVDRRWVLIRRPTIVVGGELLLDHLDIRFNPATGINEAPIHLKSNCGTLIVDDFGRQRVSSTDLLNRWIVPLEKRCDYLNLPSGRQIEVPFEQLLVLSTNLEPRELVDEAFLRRIPYKIEVTDPTEAEFRILIRRLALEMGFNHREDAVDYLIQRHYLSVGRPFRYCHPRDLLLQVRNLCEFCECPMDLTEENFDVAVKNYFAVM